MSTIIEADLTLIDGAALPGIRVEVLADGIIGRVGTRELLPESPSDVRMRGRMLMPGFVNAHSHAFQRGLRGRGEDRTEGRDSFWTWREAMYDLVAALDPASFAEWTCRAYREMLAAGITTVGEFHYVRHAGEDLDHAFDEILVHCARETGIRLVMLPVCYVTGGIGAPLSGAQRRFRSDSADQYLERFEALRAFEGALVHLGMAAHSVRGVPIDVLAELHRAAMAEERVFHLHLEEQRQEIQAALAHYGRVPMAMLLEVLKLDQRTTAVHCTHTDPNLLESFARTGAAVCLCPLTEANLADGIPSLPPALEASVTLALGTDSNARISMLEEMRWLEYAQRLRTERRGVVTDEQGRLAPRLLDAATRGGATSLGIDAGVIRSGAYADLIAIDLEHPALEGCDPEQIPGSLVLGCGDDVIAEVRVGGRSAYRATGRTCSATVATD